MRTQDQFPQVQQLVSRQLRRWQSEQLARGEKRGEEHPPGGPYLTISREPGAGALDLGREVASRLGWEYYDRRLLDRMAVDSELDRQGLDRLENGPHGALHEAVYFTLDRAYPGHHTYLKRLAALASSLATNGRVVMVGRGIHLLLPSEWGVRLRLVAPLEDRVERVRERHDWEESAARSWIEAADRNQNDLVKSLLHRDLADPHDYDLVLNTTDLAVPACIDLVVRALWSKLPSHLQKADGVA
jgi:hypothetical protein